MVKINPEDAPLPWVTKTVLIADVVESVRLLTRNEASQIARLRRLLRELETVVVDVRRGTVLERRGDCLLAAFDDSREAAAAALEMHALADASKPLGGEEGEAICLRVGMHRAQLMSEAGAAYGQDLNIAARLMNMAKPGQTILSESVRDRLVDPLDGRLHDLGLCHLRHLAAPIRAYELLAEPQSDSSAGRVHVIRSTPERSGLPPPDSIRTRLAVLPLACADSQGALPAAADVLVDQWISALSASSMLQVTTRMSSQAFKGRGIPARAAGRLLGVDFVLAGTIRSEHGPGLAATLFAVHVDSGDTIWHYELDCREEGIVDVSHPAVAGVTERLVQALALTQWRIASGHSLPNLAIHTLHLAAINHLHRFIRREFELAHELLQELRERARRHPEPLAWLARWHVFRIVQGWSDDRQADRALALEYANRALDIDPNSSLALLMAGSVQAGVQLDMESARSYYDLALERNPNEPLAWLLKGVAHGFMGEGEAAVESSERSLQLTPLDPLRYYYDSLSSAAAMGARRYERAVELAERAIRANSLHGSAYRTLAIAQSMLDRADEARRTVQRLLAIEPGSNVRQFMDRAAFDSDQNRRFAQALARAGLPPG